MLTTPTAAREIAPLSHAEAMALAQTEYQRFLSLLESLPTRAWQQPTECPGWDVRAMAGHLLGMLEHTQDPAEQARQNQLAAARAEQAGVFWIDALNALQVDEHADLSPEQVVAAYRHGLPGALAARTNAPEPLRAQPFNPGPPFNEEWTLGYLLDVILTRDVWMHRIDVCRATGQPLVLTSDHDGRMVADVVREWAARHNQPFRLVLTGPAGATFEHAADGPAFELDAIEFCRALSGRGSTPAPLDQTVPF
jgi:uncharacterized protein (TIGR03083 family)